LRSKVPSFIYLPSCGGPFPEHLSNSGTKFLLNEIYFEGKSRKTRNQATLSKLRTTRIALTMTSQLPSRGARLSSFTFLQTITSKEKTNKQTNKVSLSGKTTS